MEIQTERSINVDIQANVSNIAKINTVAAIYNSFRILLPLNTLYLPSFKWK